MMEEFSEVNTKPVGRAVAPSTAAITIQREFRCLDDCGAERSSRPTHRGGFAIGSSIIGAIVVFLTVAVAFSVNCRNELVRIDDLEYVSQNPHICEGLTPSSAVWALTTVGYAANWHPLTWISHAADVSVAKALGLDYAEESNPVGQWARMESPFVRFVHGENVAWHAANAVLLYLVILILISAVGNSEGRETMISVGIAAGCALLWAVHPLRVEVVAWASERKELLSVFFMLASLLAFLRQGASTLSIVLYALALLSKPVAVGLPAILIAVDILRGKEKWRDIAARSVPYVGLAIGTCLLTMFAQTGALNQGAAFHFKTRIGAILSAPAIYLWQTIWPMGLCFDYPMPTAADWPWIAIGGILQMLIILGGIWWLWAAIRGKACSFGWRLVPLAIAWCYICLIPMLGIIKVGYQPHSDRYTYWVGCGVASLLALLLNKTAPRWSNFRRQFAIAAVVLAAIWGGLSVAQSLLWKDNQTLMTYVISKTHNPFIANTLASEYAMQGQKSKAERMLREVVSFNRDAAYSAYAYGALAWLLARDAKAETEYWANRSLEADPDCAYGLAALGIQRKAEGDIPAAIKALEKSLDVNRDAEVMMLLEECKAKTSGQEGGK